jgi:HK97 family phage prohead protease
MKLPPLSREVPRDAITVRTDQGATTLSFPASSELPIERWFGQEVLSHESKAVRLDRAKGGAMPLLFNHRSDEPVGMVDKARIEDQRLIVDVHFFTTERAKEVAQMVADGLRNVSIGYRLHVVEEDKDSGVFTARDWEPYEVSIVSVPADPTVGQGRMSGEEIEVRMVRASTPAEAANNRRETSMSTKTEAELAAEAEAAARRRISAGEAEKQRIEAIQGLCKSNKIDSRVEARWIEDGTQLTDVAKECSPSWRSAAKNGPPPRPSSAST